MKLFDGGRAPNPRRVRVFLAEKGIEVPLVPVDMGALEHKREAVSSRNPLQRLPVLELDDGTILTETVAICRYFEELHPEPALFGTGALGRALVEMWQRRMEFNLFGPVAQAFRHIHPAMKEWEVPQIPAWGEANKAKAVEFLQFLDAELAGGGRAGRILAGPGHDRCLRRHGSGPGGGRPRPWSHGAPRWPAASARSRCAAR